ncbi:hypothetical protein L1887_36279 [Cichorium endivia]|nr:hypothetical protein L1887_36279 [Cichorium endivia]
MPGENNSPSKPTHKAYGITNIKTYVPLILDLTTRNYEPWSDLFTAHCIAYGVVDHINDSYDPPKQTPTDPKWQELDSVVKLQIFGSISQKLITSAYSVKATARKVWLNLHSLFYENVDSTAMQLENELRNITLGDSSIHDYCEKVKKIADLLEGLGEKVKDRNVVLHALNGLPSKYENVVGIIRFTKPFPSFSEMRSMLAVEETQLNTSRITTPSHENHSSSPSLLRINASSTSSNRGGGAGNYRGNTQNRRGGGGRHQQHNR